MDRWTVPKEKTDLVVRHKQLLADNKWKQMSWILDPYSKGIWWVCYVLGCILFGLYPYFLFSRLYSVRYEHSYKFTANLTV